MDAAHADSTYSTDKLNQVLEQLWQKNQVVNGYLETPDPKSKGKAEDCLPALLSLSQELSTALRQKLNYATDTLETTCRLLTALQGEQFGPPKVPLDNLAKIVKELGDAAAQLGVTENRLHEISCTFDDALTLAEAELSAQDHTIVNHVENEEGYTLTFSLHEKQLQGNSPRSGPNDENAAKIPSKENESTDRKPATDQNDSGYLNGSHHIQEEEQVSKISLEVEHTKNEQSKESQPAQQEGDIRPNHHSEGNGDKTLAVHETNGIYDHGETDRTSASRVVRNITLDSQSDGVRLKAPGNPIVKKEFLAQEDDDGEEKVACYITAPSHILQKLICRIINDMSSLVVCDSEELVSNIISVERLDPAMKISFPVTIAIPFSARYRGSYRDIMVKVYDDKFQSSYITPVSLEGYHGNHKGSFAEVKVYKFGVFSVVSCLKKETFTVPKKGLSLKPNMDSRITLNYPPGTLSASVIVQLKVQPIDASIIAALKVKHDVFHSLVATTPLIYMQHPSSQQFLKPVTTFLPCPPNPDKKKKADDGDRRRSDSASAPRASAALENRAVSASVRKHGDHITEHLKLLGFRSKEDQWVVLEDTAVKNVQNGLVSFELDEHLDSFIVLRLSSAMDSAHLIQFIKLLEEATQSTMVNVVLYRKRENENKAIVEVIPSKELNLEILSLQDEGYSGPPEPSEKIALREGEQIIFNFRGNICASGKGDASGKPYKLTFHSQRKQRLELKLKVVDEFGNYCSPHYKGTALFYKLTKEEVAKNYTHPISPDEYEQHLTPVCKLPLTLPKYEKVISRPPSTKRISTDSSDILWDKLVYWLSDELSEEDAAVLVVSLPVRRSTVQLIKLKSPDNLTEQIYELLNFWKKHLPTSADKLRLLCRHLCKSGRSDLSDELKRMWESKTFPRQLQHRFAASVSNV
ncbi:death domain-containing protein 1 [Lissotriton helveticus]